MVWLHGGEKSLMICLAVSTNYRRVTDGRTDRPTDILPRRSPRYAYAYTIHIVESQIKVTKVIENGQMQIN